MTKQVEQFIKKLDTEAARRIALRLRRSDVRTAIYRPVDQANKRFQRASFVAKLPTPVDGITSVHVKESANSTAKLFSAFAPALGESLLEIIRKSNAAMPHIGFLGLMQYVLMTQLAQKARESDDPQQHKDADAYDDFVDRNFFLHRSAVADLDKVVHPYATETAEILANAALSALSVTIGRKSVSAYQRVGEHVALELINMIVDEPSIRGILKLHSLNPAKALRTIDSFMEERGFEGFVESRELMTKLGAVIVQAMREIGLVYLTSDFRIALCDALHEAVQEAVLLGLLRRPIHGPVDYVPCDWQDFSRGGYRPGVMRATTKFIVSYSSDGANSGYSPDVYSAYYRQLGYFGEDGKIPEFMRANNVMQHTAFRINRPVLDAALALWRRGGDVAGLPISEYNNFMLGQTSHAIRVTLFNQFKRERYGTAKERKAGVREDGAPLAKYENLMIQLSLFKEQMLAKIANNIDIGYSADQIEYFVKEYTEIRKLSERSVNDATYSKVINTVYTLDEAMDKCDQDFYYVWMIDSRGRHYPRTSSLSPQGNDLNKALHLFSEGKPLTAKGLYHLKLHTMTCLDKCFAGITDLTKISLADRIAYFDKHAHIIHAIGSDPMSNVDSWKDAGEPFGFLAACVEYANCVDSNGNIKPNAVTRLPVAKDGSCNALQYCAALSRDEVLAREVNLIDKHTPGDVYTLVANEAKAYLTKCLTNKKEMDKLHQFNVADGVTGADSDVVYSNAEIYQHAVELMARKIAKQPTMTLFYGATYQGMRSQIENNLPKNVLDQYGRNYVRVLVGVLTDAVRHGIRVKVAGADRIMELNKFVVRFVAKKEKAVMLNTLDDFIVINDYKKVKHDKGRVNTVFGEVQYKLYKPDLANDPQASAQGISPNIVHSMDATHMRMTLLDLHDNKGVNSFMMIHDSFAVNAEDCDDLDKAVRKQFVKLIENRPYSTILSELIAQLDDDEYDELLEQIAQAQKDGHLDCLEVVDGKYLRLKVGTLDIKEVLNSRFFFA